MSNQHSVEESVDGGRRGALVATSVVGGIGGLCTALPFALTFQPSEKAKAAGAPVEVDIGDIKDGEVKVVEWRGQPVWIVRRTKEMLDSLAKVEQQVADPKSLGKAFLEIRRDIPGWAERLVQEGKLLYGSQRNYANIWRIRPPAVVGS